MKKIIPLFIMILLLAACGNGEEEKHRLTKAEKARLDSIDRASFKVGVMPTLDCLPMYVAQDEHLFDTLGVTVHLKYFTAQMDCDTALLGGSVEGSVSDLARVVKLNEKGADVDPLIATDTYWQVITNRLARLRQLSQLSDKMIGVSKHSATDEMATLAIEQGKPKYPVYRIPVNDVKIRLSMLQGNLIDAVVLTEPQATAARVHRHEVLLDSRDKKLNMGCLAFRKKALGQSGRKQQYQLFVKAYNMACDSINKNGVQHYQKLIKQYCGSDDKTIAALPKMTYHHAAYPQTKDMERFKH